MSKDIINNATKKIVLKELNYLFKGTSKNIKILDLGSGKGEFTKLLKNAGFEVYATDIISNPFNKDINYKKSDFNKGLKYKDNYFDAVIAIEVIEHIENPWFFMEEIYRIIKPSGHAIITTPNLENYLSRILYLFSKRFVSFGPDLSYWNNSKKIIVDKHKTPIFNFLFKEMIFQKFILIKHISNGVPPLLNRYIGWKNKNIGISKIYLINKII